ncbi:uncharacterized protein FFUJ_09024 [Fusarium fujikuroi IMI 58289]|uniref:Uncharacterized protein n=1 Tax=Gibberella fujikuroi (strain CBS 195.34 / IMI 58289 / NRRL A-6831) TaxID=1279085 RepID=S0E7R9_GIBF5|nr:uncharacterized protein FFUJ_09024 [Fusarium fujikuroi IMI 58289]CCT70949.1 uncharacterized protein FFUJ_09024 [Fusarium fujikuroi IMI 58289]SCO02617.1 uncharacterized protein FFM5_07906 [Fusarium fujikuroi]SCO52985.1 uncharacterized protein FFMR_11304 [Fusarium fujikuroi]
MVLSQIETATSPLLLKAAHTGVAIAATIGEFSANKRHSALKARERANRVELEALRFERIVRHWPVDSSRHDTYSDQLQTSGAPASSSGDHIRADSPRDLQDAAADWSPLATHTTAIELQIEHLVGEGLSDVNVSYFEYHVDMTQWRLITKRLMTKNNPWPWDVPVDERDLSQGASPVFRDWFSNRQQATPRSQHQGPVLRLVLRLRRWPLKQANKLDIEGFHLGRIARQWSPKMRHRPRLVTFRDFSEIQE